MLLVNIFLLLWLLLRKVIFYILIVSFIIIFLFLISLLECLYILLIFNTNESFLKPSPINLLLLLLLLFFLLNFFILCIDLKVYFIIILENNIFVLHDIDLSWRYQLLEIFSFGEKIFDLNFWEEFLIEISFYDQSTEFSFLQTLLENILFDCVDRDQSIDMNSFGLTNSMTSILSLFVHGWIPISIVKNDTISSC